MQPLQDDPTLIVLHPSKVNNYEFSSVPGNPQNSEVRTPNDDEGTDKVFAALNQSALAVTMMDYLGNFNRYRNGGGGASRDPIQ